jgi:hypothetical protein
MATVVLVLWIIEGAVGLTLFVSWLRHAQGRGARNVVTHLVMMLAGLAFWVWFVASGALLPAWTAFAIITVGIGFGDAMLLGRARRFSPEATTLGKGYAAAISALRRGRLPWRVVFHAWFSPAVYFTCLGVCIGATVAAA